MNKWTEENIKKYIESHGGKLVRSKLERNKHRLNVIGSCGHEFEMMLNKIQARPHRNLLCQECYNSKKFEDKFKKQTKIVKDRIEKDGYTFVDRFREDNKTHLTYIAKCGHKNTILEHTIDRRLTDVCNECSNIIKFNSIIDKQTQLYKNKLEKLGYKFLDSFNTHNKKYLVYKCACGCVEMVSVDIFNRWSRERAKSKLCNECFVKYKMLKTTEEKMKQATKFAKSKNNKILNVYNDGSKNVVEYIASCGHKVLKEVNSYINGNLETCFDCKPPSTHYNIGWAERHKEEAINTNCNVYVVAMKSEYESFFKIGITVRDIDDRFKDIHWSTKNEYTHNELYKIETNLYDAIYIEKELHDINFENSYLPNKKFGGYTECFSCLSNETIDMVKKKGGIYYG